jgi:SAM-dependent methyltransferase
MLATDRLLEERLFHDRQAEGRAERFRDPASLRFDEADYLDHETWIRPAMARLGEVEGRDILDLGCGHAMASVVLARRGARVTAVDLSGRYLAEAGRRAEANGVPLGLAQADGERLPFADGAFDRVWGNAILHHLDLDRAADELHRLLRPGGVAVFCEPLGDNAFLEWARGHLPYPGKARTRDERPLRYAQLGALRRRFPRMSCEGHQLLAMCRRLPGGRVLGRVARPADAWLLGRWPALGRYARYVVLTLPRE